MNYMSDMVRAINEENISFTNVEVASANANDAFTALLSWVYTKAQEDLNAMSQSLPILMFFYNACENGDDLYWDPTTGSLVDTTTGESMNMGPFGVNLPENSGTPQAATNFGLILQLTSASGMNIQLGDVTGDDVKNNIQTYTTEINTDYQDRQNAYSNLEQTDQSTTSDISNMVQNAASNSQNAVQMGATIAQGLSYVASLLTSA